MRRRRRGLTPSRRSPASDGRRCQMLDAERCGHRRDRRRSAAASRSRRAGRGLRLRACRCARRARRSSEASRPLAGPSARWIGGADRARARAGRELDGERARRGARPVARVVGGSDEDHAWRPGEVRRRRSDLKATRAGGSLQRERAPDAGVMLGGDLLGDDDRSRLARDARSRSPRVPARSALRRTSRLPPGRPCDDPHAPVGRVARRRLGKLCTRATPGTARDRAWRMAVGRELVDGLVVAGRRTPRSSASAT